MATNTYVEIGKVTTTGSVSSVEFTGISSGYTDLRIVNNVIGVGTGSVLMQFNNDTSTNYSITRVGGNGSTATSNRVTSQTWLSLSWSAAYTSSGRLTQIADIMNYSNTTTFKNVVCRSGKADNAVDLIAGLWRSTSAITSIKLLAETSNFASGSTFSLYGIRAEGVSPTTKATGGAVYSDSTYYYHVFGASGTFAPTQSITADVLVVAGGGGGGGRASGGNAGGGGAGGLTYYSSQSLTTSNYSITVGAGGGAGSTTTGSDGTGSQFASLTASVGGGGGGAHAVNNSAGRSGGSGGGQAQSNGTLNQGGAQTSGQGNRGGEYTTSGNGYGGCGGGGAGAAGGSATGTDRATGGQGGNGSSSYSSWVVATGVGQVVSGTGYIAGGGSGGSHGSGANAPLGGYGGGGKGSFSSSAGTAGVTNTGSGGGGACDTTNITGYQGGSGVVIVRYAK